MSEPLKTWAAVAIVVVPAAWFCWPYLSGPATGQFGAETNSPPIVQSLTVAQDFVALTRDPFARRRSLPVTVKIVSPAEPPQEPHLPEESVVPGPPIDDLSNLVDGLVLNGTLIQGDARFAIINDRLYETGSPVVQFGPPSEAPILQQVHDDRVFVSHQGRIVELRYQDFPNQLSSLDTEEEFDLENEFDPEERRRVENVLPGQSVKGETAP